jgi:methionyl-tRNA formyltransferase
MDGKILKVYKSHKEPGSNKEPAGTMITDHKTFLKIACKGGYLHLSELQLEGRKKMNVEDFLRGNVVKGGILIS